MTTSIIDKISVPFNGLLIGKPKSGKTYLAKYIIKAMVVLGKLDYSIVISTTSFTGSYDWMPKKYRYEYYNESIIENLLEFQK